MKGFREGGVWVLVVTEVMARGMDFGGVKVVVNYGESSCKSRLQGFREGRREREGQWWTCRRRKRMNRLGKGKLGMVEVA